MSATNWSARVSAVEVARRAGGRRSYNCRRIEAANVRRWEMVELLEEIGFDRGHQAEIARRLGVSRSTICRDFQLIQESLRTGMSLGESELCARIRQRIDRQESRQRQPVAKSSATVNVSRAQFSEIGRPLEDCPTIE